MKKWLKLLFILPLMLISSFSLAETSLRCNTKLVHLGATTEEVFNKCGKPDNKVTREEVGYYQGNYTGTSQIEEWYYTPPLGTQGYHLLYFKDNKLLSIEYKTEQ